MSIKPRIYKQDGYWACTCGKILGAGLTAKHAYNNWRNQFYTLSHSEIISDG
jgi:hypothetical protein